MTGAVLCIGAAHLDRKARSSGPVVLGSSNPVTTRTTMGGVARNVAENLARLGVRTGLLARVGTDLAGDEVLSGLTKAGIATDLVSRSTDSPTATYTALLSPDGELVVALADMAIYDELTPALLAEMLPGMAGYTVWFADCNLPAGTLRFLVDSRPPGVQLHIDTVSVAKAARLPASLEGIETLFANGDEAAQLTGHPIRAPLDVCIAGSRLLEAGAGVAVISMGRQGAFLASNGAFEFMPSIQAEVAEVTGAGDAMIAGYLWGRQQGLRPSDALRMGLACASLALESPDTVCPGLSVSGLLARAGTFPSLA